MLATWQLAVPATAQLAGQFHSDLEKKNPRKLNWYKVGIWQTSWTAIQQVWTSRPVCKGAVGNMQQRQGHWGKEGKAGARRHKSKGKMTSLFLLFTEWLVFFSKL